LFVEENIKNVLGVYFLTASKTFIVPKALISKSSYGFKTEVVMLQDDK
jgi:hypothetical protein